ncbi:hypothetical protein B1R32_10936 [Abditibacterium utsteinense]|uniref:Transmembrane protein n=1 Tax=Abditibacterium utsteinense TaxID=1960156 RepID=A0A2S8SSD0_9BACT|nr:hypothetical protein B1R32_10936 [Abditibacterium utsteinense]
MLRVLQWTNSTKSKETHAASGGALSNRKRAVQTRGIAGLLFLFCCGALVFQVGFLRFIQVFTFKPGHSKPKASRNHAPKRHKNHTPKRQLCRVFQRLRRCALSSHAASGGVSRAVLMKRSSKDWSPIPLHFLWNSPHCRTCNPKFQSLCSNAIICAKTARSSFYRHFSICHKQLHSSTDSQAAPCTSSRQIWALRSQLSKAARLTARRFQDIKRSGDWAKSRR